MQAISTIQQIQETRTQQLTEIIAGIDSTSARIQQFFRVLVKDSMSASHNGETNDIGTYGRWSWLSDSFFVRICSTEPVEIVNALVSCLWNKVRQGNSKMKYDLFYDFSIAIEKNDSGLTDAFQKNFPLFFDSRAKYIQPMHIVQVIDRFPFWRNIMLRVLQDTIEWQDIDQLLKEWYLDDKFLESMDIKVPISRQLERLIKQATTYDKFDPGTPHKIWYDHDKIIVIQQLLRTSNGWLI